MIMVTGMVMILSLIVVMIVVIIVVMSISIEEGALKLTQSKGNHQH